MKQNLEADRLFDPVTKPAPNLSDYEKEEIAKRAVFERLKAERLARQASIKTKWQSSCRVLATLAVSEHRVHHEAVARADRFQVALNPLGFPPNGNSAHLTVWYRSFGNLSKYSWASLRAADRSRVYFSWM
jgi:hypothetical protein